MGFMEREIQEGGWVEVETSHGTQVIPADILDLGKLGEAIFTGNDDMAYEAVEQYLEPGAKPDGVDAYTYKWGFGARLSAPGYMDCTEWAVFDTEDEAEHYLEEQYGDEEEQGEECGEV